MTTITQADRDAAAIWNEYLVLDSPNLAQAFARHREQAEAETADCIESLSAEVERLRGALRSARQIIAQIDEYMKRPDRGDWGVECACCMGELLDDDREAIARIDAALAGDSHDHR